jgi:predicted DNA-binding transcriptional regulator YafY
MPISVIIYQLNMGTAERRDEIVRALRRLAGWTVDALAAEVGASRRTVLRDLNALRDRGFEIPGRTGPGGGVRLEPTSVLISSNLLTEELVALVLSVATSRSTTAIPFAAGAERALAKLESALPAQRSSELQAFMQRIVIGDQAKDLAEIPGPVDSRFLALFEQSFSRCLVLRFTYTDSHGNRTRRQIEPHGLLLRVPYWYAIAWDRAKNEPRLFRADRVRRPLLTEVSFTPRPQDLVTGLCPDARATRSRATDTRRRATRPAPTGLSSGEAEPIPGGGSDTCSRSDTARGNPGARAQLPRTAPPASPR